MSHDPYQPPLAPVATGATPQPQPTIDAAGPRGLGGWLVLVAIGLILTPVKLLMYVFINIAPMFKHDTWTLLTSPQSEHYHALWAPLIIFETLGNILFSVVPIFLLVLFFRTSRWFPRGFILYIAANLAFLLADEALGSAIPAVADGDASNLVEIARSTVAALIWIPYMLKSKRVRNTFIRG